MPVVTIKMIEGRTDDQKRNLVEKVTEAISESISAPKEAITIILEDMKPENYAQAGVRRSDQ